MGYQGTVEMKLSDHALALLHFVTIKQRHAGGDLGGSHMQMHGVAKLEWARCFFEKVEPRIETLGHGKESGGCHHGTSGQVAAFQPRQVESHPLTGSGHLCFFTVNLNLADPDCFAR